MRTRSIALASTAAAIAAALLPMTQASATDGVTIARAFTSSGLGGVKPFNIDCDTSAAGTGTFKTAEGPGTPPSGNGSLRLGVGANDLTDMGFYKNYANLPPASLTALSFGMYGATANTWFLDVNFDRDGAGAGTTTDMLELTIPANAGWQTVDAVASTSYELWLGDSTNDGPDATGQSLAQYTGSHGEATLVNWNLDNYCGSVANSAVSVDKLKVGDNGADTTTYDFEAASAISLTGAGSIIAGQSKTLTGTLKNGNHAVAGVPLEVWAKPYGAASATKLGTTGATNSSGVATFAVKPTKLTDYYFQVAAAEPSHGAAKSATQRVTVKTAISRNVYDTTVTTTQTILAYGLTTPNKKGTKVYLYRGSTSFASATVASDGTYLLQGKITTKGTYSVTVRGGADSANLAGTSAAVTVTVS